MTYETPTTVISTHSLHDALPIFHFGSCSSERPRGARPCLRKSRRGHDERGETGKRRIHSGGTRRLGRRRQGARCAQGRSEEHTSELQSLAYLVCRLLLEKKKR